MLEADPERESRYVLTIYGAACESGGHLQDGPHVIEFGGAFDDSTWEYPNQASMPDWWYLSNSEFEIPANPVYWMPIEDMPPELLKGVKLYDT